MLTFSREISVFLYVVSSVVRNRFVQVLFVAKEHPCPLRDYMEAECKNLVGLVNRMKDRLVRSENPLVEVQFGNRHSELLTS
jgi:hypothetical protein